MGGRHSVRSLSSPPRTLGDSRLFQISEDGPHLAGFLTRALEVFSLGRDKWAISGSGLCPGNSRSPRPVRGMGPGSALDGPDRPATIQVVSVDATTRPVRRAGIFAVVSAVKIPDP